MNIKTTAKISIVEIDGERISGIDRSEITIESHWNWPKLIIIKIPGFKKEITLDGNELSRAIAKVQN